MCTREVPKREQSPPSRTLCMVARPRPVTYVLEAAVKDLQLLARETRLGFKLLQTLRAMADRR